MIRRVAHGSRAFCRRSADPELDDRPVGERIAAAALGIAMLGVAIFSVDLGSVVDLLDQSASLGFSSIVLAVTPGALGGAALLAVAAVVATLDGRRGRT